MHVRVELRKYQKSDRFVENRLEGEMNGKERMVAVLEHEEPDRVPTGELGVDYPITERILGRETFYRGKFKEKRALWEGRRDEVVESQKRDLVDLALKLGWDFVPVFLTYSAEREYRPPRFMDQNSWEDEYGNIWRYSSVTEDILCVKPKELTWEDIRTLEAPFVPDDSELELVRDVVARLGGSHFIVGRTAIELRDAQPIMGRGCTDGTFPEPYGGLLMDMTEFAYKMVDEPDFIKGVLAASTKRAIEVGKVLIREGVDAIVMDTDYCHNQGPWISPRHFEEFVLPLLKKECDAFHESGVYVIKHTDGNTWPILDMVVETGIDGLHGIQPSAGMDIKRLKERCGGRVTLFGAVEGDTLVRKTKKEVVEEVRNCIRYGAPGGGFVLTSSNTIQLGARYENCLAMTEAVKEGGKYPIAL